jgi:hypothetical protein
LRPASRRILVERRKNPNREFRLTAAIGQDEQGVQVVALVAGGDGGKGSGNTGLEQALAAPFRNL